ncbi:MAG: peptide chain release factor N(5)-glutamine methyltransferase [Alphaproteobacteria bacterium]|nr:peptide chain release factor N(5)-glutamine methyltransferase [Alphaproteobacteria bacterium]
MRKSYRVLKEVGIDQPIFDTRFLTAQALQCDRAALLAQAERDLTDEEQAAIQTLITRRANRESVARILGERDFWGLSFALNEATLEPRPDSETLIEAALHFCQKHAAISILDLGTGSGCLLLALLSALPASKGLGIDQSPRALEQAQLNAKNLGFESRANFLQSHWLDNVEGLFDLIVSNPPYIKTQDLKTLQREVRDYDPHLALDGGEDGLDAYRTLIPQLKNHMKKNALLLFEVGASQAPQVSALLEKEGFSDIRFHKDLNIINRVVSARN